VKIIGVEVKDDDEFKHVGAISRWFMLMVREYYKK
jgi:hypothetical protein